MKQLIKDAVLLDVAHWYEQADVLIENGKIAALGVNLSAEDAAVIDLQGRTLMPAFIDNHVHIKPFMGPFSNEEPILKALIENGVSAVKDLGILDDIPLEGYLDWLAQITGPGKLRIATAGRYIDVEGGYGMGPVPGVDWGIKVETPEQAAEAVRYQYRAGVDGIKIGLSDGSMGPIMGKLSPEQVRAITDQARDLGIWTTAHVYKADDLKMLVENGIGEAAHTPNDREIDDDTIAAMVERGIPMTTTIGNWTENSPLPERFPPNFPSARAFLEQQLKIKAMTLHNLKKFYEAGGTICIGTDLMRVQDAKKQATIPVNELMLLRREVGMTMHDAIRAGTVNPARVCGFHDEGAIRPGNRANLIAFTGELDDDFSKLLALEFVMNQGLVIRSEI